MASQQILFAETIAGMKKAFKRKAYGAFSFPPLVASTARSPTLFAESDSDSEIENHGNRGNKLKKRARFARQGQLAPTDGPSFYKEAIDYAGVRRTIIHRNPPLIDDEGYEVNSEDDDEQVEEAETTAHELNPYADVRLEHILAPLTASTDLPTHSTLSKPFVSQTLTDLVQQSSGMARKENRSLWKVRYMWTALCGDGNWMPCETMIGLNDLNLYSDDHVARHLLTLRKANGAGTAVLDTPNGHGPSGEEVDTNNPGLVSKNHAKPTTETQDDADQSMADAASTDKQGDEPKPDDSADKQGIDKGNASNGPREAEVGNASAEKRNGTEKSEKVPKDGTKAKEAAHKTPAEEEPGDVAMKDAEPTPADGPHADDTRNGVLSALLGGSEQPFIHPLFQPPGGARPDRDVGLPESEAEDIRRLLALYVQKQEEICRSTSRLYQGLLKAERLRKDVLHWAKSEAHCGPNRDMSDGEDWYDKEEWGLSEDLKKGQDEEEEDTTTTGKKTRNRRQ
ncbi:glycoside hydrolase family 3 [Purpureocillium lavendulum]|uniref:Glycoside hydrolase family 3 n=1 Tax=Purpureocillium lavendulum TaxID=1247861 RepID=A0AB34FSK8_9HYPO|nr:glycoside hydrolase family 3 [Purpureocillium lavendulum]